MWWWGHLGATPCSRCSEHRCGPWSAGDGVARGDGVLVVVDCEPRLVLTELAIVGDDGDVHAATARTVHSRSHLPLAALPAVTADLGRPVSGGDVIVGAGVGELSSVLHEHRWKDSTAASFGHSTSAAARTLWTSGGYCTGCDSPFDLGTTTGRDAVTVHTADDTRVAATVAGRLTLVRTDWPAALCRTCQSHLQDGTFTRFLDYRFGRHPRCPRCDGQRTAEAAFGEPVFATPELPWVDQRGCVVTPEEWTCGVCGHEW